MRQIILIVASCLYTGLSTAQENGPWRGKKAAVVLTYDDAIDQHLDHAIPVLDSLGLKATFYITGFSSSMQTRLNDWKKIAMTGHELGNHTMYHPCTGGPGREWVNPEHDLRNYTVSRILNEIKATNDLLQSMDGRTRRTFAFTCAETKVKDSSFDALIRDDFAALRNVRAEMHRINDVNPDDVDCYMVNGHTADQMSEWVQQAIHSESLLVILFHGVGGGNGLDVSITAHRDFLNYIKKNEKDIWVAPMSDVAEHVRNWQSREKNAGIIRSAIKEDHKMMVNRFGVDSINRPLQGRTGFPIGEFPPEPTTLAPCNIAIRQQQGRHTDDPNRPYYPAFARRFFK